MIFLDILTVRLFSLNVELRGDFVYLGLYLCQLPLERFNDRIGHVMKTVFALLYNVKLENAGKFQFLREIKIRYLNNTDLCHSKFYY